MAIGGEIMGEGLNYKEIGKNIRYYRIKAGLKQNQLSDIIDVSPQHISHIESGVQLSLPVLVKIANVLDVGVDVPAVGMVILAGAGKTQVANRQRIGRGLRAKKEGPNVCFVVDFDDPFNKYLVPFSIIHAFFNIPSVVLLGVLREVSFFTILLLSESEASKNSA